MPNPAGSNWVERLWSGIRLAPGDRCWEWQRGLSNGYGKMWRDGGMQFTHRLSYESVHGPIPVGMEICHSCDNPKCCRPCHLFLGTRLDNMRDAARKGRTNQGTRNPFAKLTEADVLEIRRLAGTKSQLQLGKQFGVTDSIICEIVNFKIWKHLPRGNNENTVHRS
jgi:hypothetical protein